MSSSLKENKTSSSSKNNKHCSCGSYLNAMHNYNSLISSVAYHLHFKIASFACILASISASFHVNVHTDEPAYLLIYIFSA